MALLMIHSAWNRVWSIRSVLSAHGTELEAVMLKDEEVKQCIHHKKITFSPLRKELCEIFCSVSRKRKSSPFLSLEVESGDDVVIHRSRAECLLCLFYLFCLSCLHVCFQGRPTRSLIGHLLAWPAASKR